MFLPRATARLEVLFDGADQGFDFEAAVLRHRLLDARDLGLKNGAVWMK